MQSYSIIRFSVPEPSCSPSVLLATVPAEPGPCKADDEKNIGGNGVHVIGLTDPIKIEKDSVGMRIAAETFPCKENVVDSVPSLVLNLWCDNCWEMLPLCGSLRMCAACAADRACLLAEPGTRKADVKDISLEAQLTMNDLHREVSLLMQTLQSVGQFSDVFESLSQELRDIRGSMVTRDALENLSSRLRELEGDDASVEEDEEIAHGADADDF